MCGLPGKLVHHCPGIDIVFILFILKSRQLRKKGVTDRLFLGEMTEEVESDQALSAARAK
jgi:hypothetical protein